MTEKQQFTIVSDPETLRLIADPLRLRVLELLRRKPRTVTELAELLEMSRTNLYYHVRLLESHNLITIEETRQVSGITEKRYRASAYRLSVEKSLLGQSQGRQHPLDVYLSFVLDEVAGEIRRAVDAGLIEMEGTDADTVAPGQLMMGRSWFHLTDDEVAAFGTALAGLFRQFDQQRAIEPSDQIQGRSLRPPDGQGLYEFLAAFYPVIPPGGDDDV